MSLEIFFHLSSAEELVGCSQVSALHLHEDGLSIDEAALAEVEVDSGTEEFLCEHRDIEMVGIVACEIATCKFLLQCGSQLLEGRSVLDVFVADACEGYDLCRNLLLRIDEEVLSCLCSVRTYLDV